MKLVASIVVVVLGLVLGLVAGCGSSEEPAAEAVEPTALDPGEEGPGAGPLGGGGELAEELEQRIEFGTHRHRMLGVREGARVRVHDSPGGEVIGRLEDRTEWSSPTVLSVVEIRRGWAGFPTPLRPSGELAWVELDPQALEGGSTPWSVRISLGERRAELRKGSRVADEFAVNVGAPGSETPTGRFAVTDTFMGDLNAAYGCCAVALTARQANVPSGWFGGDRIAIHGNPGALPGADSAGCVRAEDEKVRELVHTLWPGTPVFIEA